MATARTALVAAWAPILPPVPTNSGMNRARAVTSWRAVSNRPITQTVIVAAGILLFIQGMAQVCRCILAMRTNEWLAAEEDVFETEDLLMEQATKAEKDAHP